MSIYEKYHCKDKAEYIEKLAEYRESIDSIRAAAQKGVVLNLNVAIPVPPGDMSERLVYAMRQEGLI